MEECPLCKDTLGKSNVVTVGDKGRYSLVAASIKRDDGLKVTLETITPLQVHGNCRKNYTRQTSIASESRNSLKSR